MGTVAQKKETGKMTRQIYMYMKHAHVCMLAIILSLCYLATSPAFVYKWFCTI